jgi:hypothetical protein
MLDGCDKMHNLGNWLKVLNVNILSIYFDFKYLWFMHLTFEIMKYFTEG